MTTDSSSVDSGDAGGAGCKAPPEIGGSEKGQNLTFAYWSLAITASTSAFEKLSKALDSTRLLESAVKTPQKNFESKLSSRRFSKKTNT